MVKCTSAVCSTVTRCAHITATHSCNTPLQHTPATPSCDTLLQHTPANWSRHVARVLTTASHYCNTQLHHTPTPTPATHSYNTSLPITRAMSPLFFLAFFSFAHPFFVYPPPFPPFFLEGALETGVTPSSTSTLQQCVAVVCCSSVLQ